MDNNRIIRTLENLRNYCIREGCEDCVFNIKGVTYSDDICQITLLVNELKDSPENWNIEKIKILLE